MSAGPYNVLLVFPRFNGSSFWNLEAACKVVGRRCFGPPLGCRPRYHRCYMARDYDVDS
jgi:hypothetical protein